MRPYVSGSSYVNYCDLDIPYWATAYWGLNLPRLRRIKSIYDPDNLFVHSERAPDENLLCLIKSTVKHSRTPARGTGCLEGALSR